MPEPTQLVLAEPTALEPVVTTDEEAVQLGFEMPRLLISLLERRYLGDFDASMWSLKPVADDGGRPLLREVVGMGRAQEGQDWSLAMPHVLTSTHALGHATVMVLHGEGSRQRLYLGGRRLEGMAQGSTEDFVDGQASLLQAHLPGLELAAAGRIDHPELSGLADFLRTAPAMAVVTGVPSPRAGLRAAVFQNLDRLAHAAGNRRYSLVVVAEPLQPVDLDLTIDRCRQLKSEIHALVRRTVSRSTAEGTTRTTSVPDRAAQRSGMMLPASLSALAVFCAVAGAFTPLSALTSLVTPVALSASTARGLTAQAPASNSSGTSRTRSQSGTAELLDANAEACEAILQRHINRLEAARSSGWWRTSVYVAAESDAALEAVTSALRGIASGEATALDPVRVIRVAPHLVRTAALHCRTIGLTPAARSSGHPLGPAFDALATCLTSDELAVLVAPPRREVPGLPLRDVAEFALSAPPPTSASIELGVLEDGVGHQLAPVNLTTASLNRHVFIAGMTGYGKTTTAKRLLMESFSTLGLPFLVIEPVKGEYRRLADHPELRDRLRVYTIGNEGGETLPLRLNPFVPVKNVPLLRHIDLLKAVFNASFPMFAGMSYVLEEAILGIYADYGWNLHSSANDVLGPAPNSDDLGALVPTVADLPDKVEEVLAGKKYGREVHQNMGAALRSRLGSLLVGTKGMTLSTRRSVPAQELFGGPRVIELRNLGDDEEKAFVMALLLCQLYEFAESRQSEQAGVDEALQHLTLIEEAHRLLRATRAPGNPETPDAQAKAVTMFTDMLAEMRAYGEGFLVADQIPTKLAPEVLKNSSVKILHRLVAPDDRAVAASSVNLTEAQSRHLGSLSPGVAVVHDDRSAAAGLVRITPLAVDMRGRTAGTTPSEIAMRTADRSYLHRHGGCRSCPSPCSFLVDTFRVAPREELDTRLGPLFEAVLGGDGDGCWARWTAWRAEWLELARQPMGGAADDGGLYCAFTQSAHRWLGRLLTARASAVWRSRLAPAARLAQDRCARAAGRLAATWQALEEFTGAGEQAFGAASRTWQEQLTSRPPHEMPGCRACPARCRVLGELTALNGPVMETVAARATATASIEARTRNLIGIDDSALQDLLGRHAEARSRARLLYCAVTTSTARRPAQPEDLLNFLRRVERGEEDFEVAE